MPLVVQTRPREERRAEKHLLEQGYQVFLPLCIKSRSAKPSPLFPRYLFVWIPDLKPWRPISSTPGVCNIVPGLNREPGVVPESKVQEIRDRMAAGGGAVILINDEPLKRSFTPGQPIRVIGGTYQGIEGLFVSRANDRIIALLNMFGGQVRSSIPEADVA